MTQDLYQELYQIIGLTKRYIKEETGLSIPTPLSLAQIRQEIDDCQRCKLHSQRRNIVLGSGDEQADILIVGEAPGAEEDLEGEPFIGPAGQLLTRMLTAINLKREEVYITNVVKCRPPGNRNPLPEEIAACQPYLISQIKAIRPKIIFTLGNYATQTLLKTTSNISQLRGKVYDYQGINLLPSFHPSALLRNESLKKLAWKDLQLLREKSLTSRIHDTLKLTIVSY